MIDLDKIHSMWEQDSKLDPANLDNTSIDSAKLHAKYLQLFDSARLLLKKKEIELAELKLLKWRYYAGKMTKHEMDELDWDYDPFHGATKPMKNELNQYIEADADISRVRLKIEYIKVAASALEEIINTLRWRHQTIKNILDFRRFQAGG